MTNNNLVNLKQFLELKLSHEPHAYHKEGTNCIYQDLAKNRCTIREIIYIIKNNKDYLCRQKYQKSNDIRIQQDHMLHYINCIEYGFRKNIKDWRSSTDMDLIHSSTYENSPKMTNSEIDELLKNNPISFNSDGILTDGNHRVLSMLGRILRYEKYIPFRTQNNITVNKKEDHILPVVGYRPESSKKRLIEIMKNIKGSYFSAIDIGSNYGYFSTNIALNNPNSLVMSFEGSFGTGNASSNPEYSEGINTHFNTIENNKIFNNKVIPKLFSEEIMESLIENDIVFDYTLLLSVFHWMIFYKYENNASIQQIEDLFVKMLKISKTIFLELPEAGQKTSISCIYDTYQSLPNFFTHLKNKYFNSLDYNLLLQSDWYGKRDLYMISHDIKSSTLDELKSLIN